MKLYLIILETHILREVERWLVEWTESHHFLITKTDKSDKFPFFSFFDFVQCFAISKNAERHVQCKSTPSRSHHPQIRNLIVGEREGHFCSIASETNFCQSNVSAEMAIAGNMNAIRILSHRICILQEKGIWFYHFVSEQLHFQDILDIVLSLS